jgi:putative MATE family efflux protein
VSASPRQLSLVGLAWPLFVEQGFRYLIWTVDTFMVSRVSDGAVAAVSVAMQVMALTIICFNFIGVGANVVITHHLGAGDRPGAKRIAAGPILRLLGLPEHLMPYALPLLQLMGGTLFVEAQNVAMSAALRAHGLTRETMLVGAAQNLLNACGNYLLLFGPFGLPRLGVVGVAVSGVFGRLCAHLVLRALLRRRLDVRLRARDFSPLVLRGEPVRRILHIGLPAAGEGAIYWLALMTMTSFVGRMGAAPLVAYSYTRQIITWVLLFALSIGLGTEIMVGHLVGAGRFDEAYRSALKNLRVGLLLALATSAALALSARPLLGVFTRDQAVIDAAALLLKLGLALETGRIFNLVLVNALRATGDARFPAAMAVASMWGVWVPLAWLLGVERGLGLPGIWIAMIVDEWLRGIIMFWRWRRRDWVPYAERSRAKVAAPAG